MNHNYDSLPCMIAVLLCYKSFCCKDTAKFLCLLQHAAKSHCQETLGQGVNCSGKQLRFAVASSLPKPDRQHHRPTQYFDLTIDDEYLAGKL